MLQHFYQNERTSRLARVLALMIAASFLFAVCAAAADFFMCYEVSVDGEVVGYVDSPVNYDNAVHAVEDYASAILGSDYSLHTETACTLRLASAEAETDVGAVVDAMLAEVTEISHMYMLTVDGNDVVGVSDPALLEEVLEAVKAYYVRGDEVHELTFANSVEIVEKTADSALLCDDYDELLALLMHEEVVKVSASYRRSVVKTVARVTETVYDDTQYLDYEELIEGTDGIIEVYEEYTLVNGEEVESTCIGTKIRQEVVHDVIVRGTMEIPPTRPTGTYINPVDAEAGKFTSDFGKRGRYEKHTGVDIAARSGTSVYASDSGKVTFASWKGNYGHYVIIEHGDGVETRYAHLRKMNVKVGEEVIQGQVIGQVGSTGRSTGPHLHFEILKDGEVVDPNDYIDMSVYADYR